MSTKADQFRANALHEVGEDYVWGAEGSGGVAGDDNYDCSGFEWAMLNDVGVHFTRTTAEGFRQRGERITAPSKVGADFGVLVDSSGHAFHIAPYIGKGEIVEAKGSAYGVVKTTVAAWNAKGARWYRFPGVELGRLTGSSPAPTARRYPGHLIAAGHGHADEVAWVQKHLNKHGAHLVVDGDFGRLTDNAVHNFQRAHHLVSDGVVGPHTWAALAK